MASWKLRFARLALAAGAALTLAACSSEVSEEEVDSDEGAFTGTPDDNVGQFFMVDHFGVVPTGYGDVDRMIREKNLGAVILWNPTEASGGVARQMAQHYADVASRAGRQELFFSVDHEGRGTQRFRGRHGFTDLVDANTLGRIVAREGNANVCELHGRISARELASAGFNMSLGVTSDLYIRDSGTRGMFSTRGVATDPAVVESCVRAMVKAYSEEGHVVYITKHFPGLGNASGNTDVSANVRTYSDTKAEMDNELAPYRGVTGVVNRDGTWPLFGAMISHASYPILDRTNTPATLSSKILGDFLRANPSEQLSNGVDRAGQSVAFAGMGLKGVTVSDAFWTWSAAKDLPAIEKRRMMARTFLAGMDILMISKVDFNGAWTYFQQLQSSELPATEQAALVEATGLGNWNAVVARFRERSRESAARIRDAKSRVGRLSSYVGSGEARASTTELQAQYRRLTQ